MSDDAPYVPRLPEHPELREIALVIEHAGMMAEILDARFRCVFISTETARAVGASAEEADGLVGMSLIVRNTDAEYAEIVRVTEQSGADWARHNVPIMRRYVRPGDPDFGEIFGSTAPYAAHVEPTESSPRAWHDTVAFPSDLRFRRTMLGDQHQVFVRINDDTGEVIGFLYVYRGTLGETC